LAAGWSKIQHRRASQQHLSLGHAIKRAAAFTPSHIRKTELLGGAPSFLSIATIWIHCVEDWIFLLKSFGSYDPASSPNVLKAFRHAGGLL
jgi:hypothetical protein